MKKDSIKILVIVALIAVLAGISYAFWQITRVQNDKNIVTTGCFELVSDIGTDDELEAIRLLKTYPIADSEGQTLSPFTFTIRNTCDTYAGYQINLESLNTTTLNLDYLKAVMDESTPKVLSAYDVVEKTLNDATTSHKLLTGGLKSGATKTFNLRLWLDQDTPLEAGQNKTYEGKIVIIASPEEDKTATTKILSLVEGADASSTDVITKDAPDSSCTNTLAYDGTTDNNLRYVGVSPCNYACFNGECPSPGIKYIDRNKASGKEYNVFATEEECNTFLTEHNYTETEECIAKNKTTGGWLIIGIMNNIDDGTGKKETRVKLLRNDRLGAYSWDLSETSINDGGGINQWGPSGTYEGSDLMRELNTDYLNYNLTSNPMWYGWQDGYTQTGYESGYGQNTVFDRTNVLSANAQELIGDAIWYSGALNDTSIDGANVTAEQIYVNERSNNPHATNNGKYCSSGASCNDIVTRTHTWTGKVALINMSDYMYATSGGSTLNRNNCLATSVVTNNYWENNDCSKNNWINNGRYQWVLSTRTSSEYAHRVGIIGDDGSLLSSSADWDYFVRPSIYLLPEAKIIEGNGSETNPYLIN